MVATAPNSYRCSSPCFGSPPISSTQLQRRPVPGVCVTRSFSGVQGAEGHSSGAEWFIEDVIEELDAPNEFFYDKEAKELYLYYNVSHPWISTAI